MPINLVDTLATSQFAEHNLLDLSANNVKGIGFYDTLSDVFNQRSNQRCLGFLACVSGTESQAVYQYTATTLDTWTSPDSWTQLGGAVSESSDTGLSPYTMDLKTTTSLAGKYDIALAPFYTDFSKVPTTFELRFDSKNSFPYDINTRGLHSEAPQYAERWTHSTGPFVGKLSSDVLPGQVFVKMRASWGTEFNDLTHSGTVGWNGLSGDALSQAATGTWVASGGTAAEIELRAFLEGLPPVKDTLHWLYIGDYLSSPLYLLHDPSAGAQSGTQDISSIAAKWTPVNAALMSLNVTRAASGGAVTPDTSSNFQITYPDTKRASLLTVGTSRENGFSTVDDLLNMRMVITLNPIFQTFAENYLATAFPQIEFDAQIYVEL